MGCSSCGPSNWHPVEAWNKNLEQIIQGLCSACQQVKPVRRVKDQLGKYSCKECESMLSSEDEQDNSSTPQSI